MFASSISQVGGNVPEDLIQKIDAFSGKFFSQLSSLIENSRFDRRIVRLIHPVNVAVLLDDISVNFILSLNVGGIQIVRHIDFRGKGNIPLNIGISIVERDLLWKECFGFSVPVNSIINEMSDDSLFVFVDSYYKSEQLYFEKIANIVRINPIFNGREFLINKQSVFVLMPFTDSRNLQEIYQDYLKPAVDGLGFYCSRADDIYNIKPIIETIWESINKAGIIIAELTGKNPNVFYELGIAHTVGKDVILLSQDINDVPFDLRHLRVIIYDFTPKGIETMKAQLISTIMHLRK